MRVGAGWVMAVLLGGCVATGPPATEGAPTPVDDTPRGLVGPVQAVSAGQTLVLTEVLPLRTAPEAAGPVRTVLLRGARVRVLEPALVDVWAHVSWQQLTGWVNVSFTRAGLAATVSAQALPVDTSGFAAGGHAAPPVDAGAMPPDAGVGDPLAVLQATVVARAAAAVGFSYFWGHGSWSPGDVTALGSCTGNCPACTHVGRYGADCSGLVAKVWQVPDDNVDPTVDQHPYSTIDFVAPDPHWAFLPRTEARRADAYVYNVGGAGHIFLVDSADAWGWVYAYEARGCLTGVVHDLREVPEDYLLIRRTGF